MPEPHSREHNSCWDMNSRTVRHVPRGRAMTGWLPFLEPRRRLLPELTNADVSAAQCFSVVCRAGSYSVMYPATALAATVSGDARYIWPGPLRPGKLRFCALMTIWSGLVETPGPALMQAPHDGSMMVAPAFSKIAR